jgi:hypothetical protein
VVFKKIFCFALALSLVAATVVTSGAEEWAVKADYAESCSCNPSCPCTYGSAPTLGHCTGASLLEIKKGHYGDVPLDGITVVSTFSVGDWVKYSISDGANNEQVKAAEQLMPNLFGYHKNAKVLSSGKAPVSVERTATNVKYSVPSTTVEIAMMKGYDGGPIRLQNIPVQGFPAPKMIDAVQYKSVKLNHQGTDKEFSYTGTNGYTGRLDASGGE